LFFTGLRCMKLLVSSLNMRRTWNRHRTWQWHVRRFYYPNHAPNLVLTCFREFRNFITTFLINLVVRKLPREHSRRSAVAACSSTQLGWRWRWRGPIFRGGADLLVAFTNAGWTCAESVVACARWWIWRS
jgi:hypothetical protein